MIRSLSTRHVFALLSVLTASCSAEVDHAITIDRRAGGYTLGFRIADIEGLCYAPGSARFHGHLELLDFKGVNRWMLARVEPSRVEKLDAMLSMPRRKIGKDRIEVSVDQDAVVATPSYVQLVVFSCDTAPGAKSKSGPLYIMSLAADLPPARPGTREQPYRGRGSDDMMVNLQR